MITFIRFLFFSYNIYFFNLKLNKHITYMIYTSYENEQKVISRAINKIYNKQ